jgi:hypothetical protein
MPRHSKSPTPEFKPYTKQTSSDAPQSEDTPKKRGAGRPWTSEDLIILFDVVVKHGASTKSFEGAIEGRTRRQCVMTWWYVLSIVDVVSMGRY